MKIYKTLSFWFGIIVILSMFWGTFMHEQAHVSINEAYGLESEVRWFSDFPSVSTYIYGDCNDNCELLHEMNEIVTYNFDDLKIIVGFGLLFIMIILELMYNEMKERRRMEYEQKY